VDLPVQSASSKSLSVRWWGQSAQPITSSLVRNEYDALDGELSNPLPIALTDCLVAFEGRLYRLGKLQPGQTVNLGTLTPLNLEARLTELTFEGSKEVSTVWKRDANDIPRIVQMLMFHESARGRTYTGLTHRYQPFLDLSGHLGLGRAVLVGKAAEPFIAFVGGLLAVMRRLLWWVIRLTPIGSAGLLGTAVASYGWDALAKLGWFAGAVYIGLAIVLFLVYPAVLLFNGISPARFFAGAWPAIQLGFVSRSSIGTLPVTEKSAEDLGVPRSYAAFAVPLAATTKMDGCAAIYPAISAIFVAQFYGLPLGLGDYALIAFVSVIGSAATAGLTGAVVMLTLTLSTLGLPLEGAGLLLAIDPILDMGRTAVNVAGQILVPMIVARREGILEEPNSEHSSAAQPSAA